MQARALDWESNRRPFGLQSGTQSTEPHQSGLSPGFFLILSNVFQTQIYGLIYLDAEAKQEHGEDVWWESLFSTSSSSHGNLQLKLIHKFTAACQL